MRKITILLTLLFFVGMQIANAQQRSISGKVISSEDGTGIPGVSISVKGTTVGTVTDVNGDFRMDIDNLHETLIFQYLGMKTQEIEIGSTATFNTWAIGSSTNISLKVVMLALPVTCIASAIKMSLKPAITNPAVINKVA